MFPKNEDFRRVFSIKPAVRSFLNLHNNLIFLLFYLDFLFPKEDQVHHYSLATMGYS